MRILFTGASSFTGYWFAKTLSDAGHEVACTYSPVSSEAYSGIRRARVTELETLSRSHYECSFGSPGFLRLIEAERWDVVCHHGADVTGYKSAQFDFARALSSNTNNLGEVCGLLSQNECRALVLTGSVFEPGQGAGSDDLPAFSPYGLSKGMTTSAFRYFTRINGLTFGRFVISNPFGPLEEARFTEYLMRTWSRGEVAEVRTPDYVRDNIHVSLLAENYRWFLENLSFDASEHVCDPSGYVGSQGDFTARFAREMSKRLPISTEFRLLKQTAFEEPQIRINTMPANRQVVSWSEQIAWDELAKYYAASLSIQESGSA